MRLGTALGCVKQVSLLWRESSRVALRTRESERLWVCTTSSAPTIDGIAEGLTWCSTPINMGHFRGGWYHTCYRMNESDTGKIHFSNVLKKKKNHPFCKWNHFEIDEKISTLNSISGLYIYIYMYTCVRFVSFWKIDAVIYRLKCQLIWNWNATRGFVTRQKLLDRINLHILCSVTSSTMRRNTVSFNRN